LYRLAEERRRSRLTQHELAKLSGVSRPTIAAVERGYRGARMSTIRKLARVLKVNPEDLLDPPHGRRVNVKSGEPYDVYIGWENGRYGLKRSIWRNPFNKAFRREEITREESVERYREYVLSNPELIERLPEIRGKVLGCWCEEGEPCHGDVLLRLALELP
jgi:transcriptional regulator with XRE-family HTH domain